MKINGAGAVKDLGISERAGVNRNVGTYLGSRLRDVHSDATSQEGFVQ